MLVGMGGGGWVIGFQLKCPTSSGYVPSERVQLTGTFTLVWNTALSHCLQRYHLPIAWPFLGPSTRVSSSIGPQAGVSGFTKLIWPICTVAQTRQNWSRDTPKLSHIYALIYRVYICDNMGGISGPILASLSHRRYVYALVSV